jgi:hypothetical protein
MKGVKIQKLSYEPSMALDLAGKNPFRPEPKAPSQLSTGTDAGGIDRGPAEMAEES